MMYGILVFLAITVLHVGSRFPCSDEACTGPYKLVSPKLPEIVVTSEKHAVTVSVLTANEVNMTIGYRSRYTAYCYDGTSLDSNTGCDKSHTFHPPDEPSLKTWEVQKKCSYGIECKNGGSCWGDDAKKCFDDSLTTNWKPSKEYAGNNEEYMYFPHHACISTWRCGFKTAKTPLFHKKVSGKWLIGTYGLKGEFLEAGKWAKVDQETSVFVHSPPPVNSVEDNWHCYGSTESSTMCQVPRATLYGEYAGTIVELENPINETTIGPIRVAFHEDRQQRGKGVNNHFKMKHDLESASSLSDLKRVVSMIIYNNRETNYNLVEVLKIVKLLQDQVITLVNSVAKIDDELVGKILKVQSKTKWFNERLFKLCPCYQVPLDNYENCNSGYMFAEGRIKRIDDQSKCATYAKEAVSELKIAKDYILQLSTLSFPPTGGVTSSWEGWSWMVEEKQSMISAMNFANETTNGDPSKSLLNYLNEMNPLTYKAMQYWSWISSFNSWIALVIAILAYLKR